MTSSRSSESSTPPPPKSRGKAIVARGLSAARNPSAALAAANVGSQFVSFLSGVIVARQLGTLGRGQIGLLQAYDDVSTNVLSLGVPDATAFFVKERVDSEARVLGAALKFSLLSLPLTALVGWAVGTFAFRNYPVGLQLTAWLAIGLTPFANTFFAACRMVLVARGQVRSLVPLQLASMGARIGSLLVLVGTGMFTATTAALAFIISSWLGQYLAWRWVKVRPRGGGSVRALLTYGIKTVPASLTSMANTRLDQLLVAPLLSTSALGIYSVAVGVNVVPLAVGVAIAQAEYHKVRGTRGDTTGGGMVLRRATLAILTCSLASVIGIVLFLEAVYGAAFHDSVRAAIILVPGSAATGLFYVVWSTGNAIGDPALAGKAQLAGLIVTLGGLPILLPAYGVNGAAIVSSTSYLVRLIVGLWLLRRDGVTWRS